MRDLQAQITHSLPLQTQDQRLGPDISIYVQINAAVEDPDPIARRSAKDRAAKFCRRQTLVQRGLRAGRAPKLACATGRLVFLQPRSKVLAEKGRETAPGD